MVALQSAPTATPCLAKKRSCRQWTHACIHVFLQPKAAYFRNTHLFLEMLKKTAIKGTKIETAHTHTHLLKTTSKRTTPQRKNTILTPSSAQLSTFLLHHRSWLQKLLQILSARNASFKSCHAGTASSNVPRMFWEVGALGYGKASLSSSTGSTLSARIG